MNLKLDAHKNCCMLMVLLLLQNLKQNWKSSRFGSKTWYQGALKLIQIRLKLFMGKVIRLLF